MVFNSGHNKDSAPSPRWTRVMPWVVLIVVIIVCTFVVKSGCSLESLRGQGKSADLPAQKSKYSSEGIREFEVVLEKTTVLNSEFTLDGINFARGSASLDTNSYVALDQLLDVLKKYNSVRIRLEGYCTQHQDAKTNLRISHQRAAVIANYMIERGIESSRIRTVGRGDSKRKDSASLNSGQYLYQSEFVGLVIESR